MDCLSRTLPFQSYQRRTYLQSLRFLSLHSFTLSPSTSVLFLSKRPLKWLTFAGDLVVALLLLFFLREKRALLSHTSNIQQALLWNCTDLGQRLISLSLLTKPGLRVRILLAFRPLWFNIAPEDMTSHHRQRLCDISFAPMQQKRWWSFPWSSSIIYEQLGSRTETAQNLGVIRQEDSV